MQFLQGGAICLGLSNRLDAHDEAQFLRLVLGFFDDARR